MRTSTHNICLDEARKWGDAEYMTDGLVLTDSIAHSLLMDGPVRLNFIVMGLCNRHLPAQGYGWRPDVYLRGTYLGCLRAFVQL